jgi:hypothetical protein
MDDAIARATSSTALLLVFVTTLFNAKQPELRRLLEPHTSRTPDEARLQLRALRSALWGDLLPMLGVTLPSLVILGAVALRIVTESHLTLGADLDYARTVFIFVTLLVAAFAFWSVRCAVRLVRRYFHVQSILRRMQP